MSELIDINYAELKAGIVTLESVKDSNNTQYACFQGDHCWLTFLAIELTTEKYT